MKAILKAITSLSFIAVIFSFNPLVLAEARKVPETIPEWIYYYADAYNTDYTELLAVAKCESGLKVNAVGDSGRAYSILQFHKSTFESWEKKLGENLDYYNFQHQIKLGAWAFSQGEKYKDDWTCWRNLYNS